MAFLKVILEVKPRNRERGLHNLARNKGLCSILQLMEETRLEKFRADQELQDPSTRELGELRLRLVSDRYRFLDLLKRSQDLSDN